MRTVENAVISIRDVVFSATRESTLCLMRLASESFCQNYTVSKYSNLQKTEVESELGLYEYPNFLRALVQSLPSHLICALRYRRVYQLCNVEENRTATKTAHS